MTQPSTIQFAGDEPEEYRTDAERLNWLDRQWRDGVHLEVCAEQSEGLGTWHTLRPYAALYDRTSTVHVGTTARQAIDAAMKARP